MAGPVRVAARRGGKPAIVLLHGYRGSPLGLSEVVEALRKRLGEREILTPALPPFGGAGELHEYTPDAYAKYVADWIRKQKFAVPPVVVGHSMGSIVVAALVARYPELVAEQVVLMAPIAGKAPRPITMLAPLATLIPNRAVSWLTTRYLYAAGGREGFRHALDLTVRCGADCDSKRGSQGAAKFASAYCIGDFEICKDKRILFLAGEKDRLNSQKKVRKVAEKFGGEVMFLPKCGHILNYECPERVACAISDFLKKAS